MDAIFQTGQPFCPASFLEGLVVVDVRVELNFLGDEARAVLASREKKSTPGKFVDFGMLERFIEICRKSLPKYPWELKPPAQQKNPLPFGNGFCLVEISGIEPLTS